VKKADEPGLGDGGRSAGGRVSSARATSRARRDAEIEILGGRATGSGENTSRRGCVEVVERSTAEEKNWMRKGNARSEEEKENTNQVRAIVAEEQVVAPAPQAAQRVPERK
jgi:hypothetical protein